MAALSSNNLTLADWAKRVDPNGRIAKVGELLSQRNEILTDAVFKPSNGPTSERVVVRTGLPTVYWRALNVGIAASKSTSAQVDEPISILEARSEVDVDLALLNGDVAAFRLSEDVAFLEAMNQKQAYTMFYGNPATDEKEYLGLASRYSSLSSSVANSVNVLNAGGSDTAENTSVWLVCWSEQTVYCTFPKGSKAGLQHDDYGEQTVYTPSSSGATTASATERMQAYVSRYQWKNGLVVKDWRYAVRICNIDLGDLVGVEGTQQTTDATFLPKLMTRALMRLPNPSMGRCAFYMNRSAYSGLAIAAMDKTQNVLSIQQGLSQFGTPMNWLTFMGVPIRCVDAISNTEAVVA